MVSPWQTPLPISDKTSRVVVYFYSDRLGLWIPIMFLGLIEAIALHHKGIKQGAEFFVFPLHLDPCNWGLVTLDWQFGTLGLEKELLSMPYSQ